MKPRVRVPKSATPGEIIEIKTLIQHPMHNGFHRDGDGNVIPQMIIHTFEMKFDGETVFKGAIEPGTAENPYFAIAFKVERSGTFDFRWEDENGEVAEASKDLNVT